MARQQRPIARAIMSYHDRLAIVFAASWLGHGRAIECYLALVAGLYGTTLLAVPDAAYDSKATIDIAWTGYGSLLAIPLLAKAGLTGAGLILNVLGCRGSRLPRFFGALLGSLIWSWLATKLILIGAVATTGFPFCVGASLFSVRIMGMALANLPRPGAPGAL